MVKVRGRVAVIYSVEALNDEVSTIVDCWSEKKKWKEDKVAELKDSDGSRGGQFKKGPKLRARGMTGLGLGNGWMRHGCCRPGLVRCCRCYSLNPRSLPYRHLRHWRRDATSSAVQLQPTRPGQENLVWLEAFSPQTSARRGEKNGARMYW